jgi:phage tail-like protein
MVDFKVNTTRKDPYKNFRILIKWDGRYVAGLSKMSALKRTAEVVKHGMGGDASSSRKSLGRAEYEAITLERGVTHDPEFENWANKVWNFGAGLNAEETLAKFRKDIIIELLNEAGQVAIVYKVYCCWVSEFNRKFSTLSRMVCTLATLTPPPSTSPPIIVGGISARIGTWRS